MIDVGLRARKKERTRNDLLAVALRLFSEQGFEATTVEQIAAAADVSPRTFFRYFSNKEDVLFVQADGDARTEALLSSLRHRAVGEPAAELLRDSLLTLIGTYEDELETLLLRKQIIAATPALRTRALQHRERWEDSVVEVLLGGLRDRRDPDELLAVRVTVAATAAALNAAVEVWLDTGGSRDLAALVGQAFEHLADGLGARSTAARSARSPARARA